MEMNADEAINLIISRSSILIFSKPPHSINYLVRSLAECHLF